MIDMFTARDAVLPAYFPGVLLRMLLARGHREADLLRGTGLTAKMFSDDDFRYSFAQHQRFVENAIAASNDAHLGIQLGKTFNVAALGIVGYAASSCLNLESALNTVVTYLPLRTPAYALSLSTDREHAALQIDEPVDFGPVRYFLLGAALCGIERLLSYLAENRCVVSHASISCAAPAGWSDVAPSVGFPIEFDQPATRLYIPKSHLALELTLANAQNELASKRICERQLARLREQRSIAGRIRAYIHQQRRRYPHLEEVASHFGMSPRTLRRELQKEGTTFQSLADKVREDIAIRYLTTTRKPISAIAAELGYDELSNFARAFRRWTGKTPSDYRKPG
jgi:AraC-like DNA-binding protein